MAKFQNREEYEKWKEEKTKPKQDPSAITEQVDSQAEKGEEDKSPSKPPSIKKSWYTTVGSFTAAILIIVATYNFYEHHYKPKKVAEAYLKAVQLHDYKRLFELSSGAAFKGVLDGVLINLIGWNFVDEKKISNMKKPLDVSEETYNKNLALYLEISKVTSADALPYDWLKEEYKSYDLWRSKQLQRFEPIEEAGRYYYFSDEPAFEYLLDITATNKLGTELKKKYILLVEKTTDWEVTKFEER